MIVLGNSAVLVTLLVSKSRKSRMNFFIKQLAIAGESRHFLVTNKIRLSFHVVSLPSTHFVETANFEKLTRSAFRGMACSAYATRYLL